MLIKTNIPQMMESADFLFRNNINLVCEKDSSPFEMAQRKKPSIIYHTDSAATARAAREYPDIRFLSAEDLAPKVGIDCVKINETGKDPIKSACSFINTAGEQNKLFLKRIECLGMPVNTWGDGFGISKINDPRGIPDPVGIYKNSKCAAASSPQEALKILYCGIPCLTPFDMPYCNNIFKIQSFKDISIFEGQVEFASKHYYANVFKEFFDKLDMSYIGGKLK